MHSPVYRLLGVVIGVAVGLLAACATKAPPPVAKANAIELTATVETIDTQLRLVGLRTPDGREVVVGLTPEVRNFAQIKVGDVVTATYYEAIGAALAATDKGVKSVEQTEARLRAAAGARPGTAVGQVTTTTVVVESVDTSFNTVTFKRADGKVRTVAINDSEAQAFIRKLKRGDSVQVVYMEAVAVAVRPAR